MRNKLIDLNNHLFEQLERLNDEDLTDDELEREIKRSNSIKDVAKNIINNAELAFRVAKYIDEYGSAEMLPQMLEAVPKKGV